MRTPRSIPTQNKTPKNLNYLWSRNHEYYFIFNYLFKNIDECDYITSAIKKLAIEPQVPKDQVFMLCNIIYNF